MKRIVTAVCGLALIGAVSGTVLVHSEPQSFAQQPTPFINKPDIVFSDNPEQAATDEAVFRAVEPVAAAAAEVAAPAFIANDVQPAALIAAPAASAAREEVLQLLRRRVELMDDKEISALFPVVKKEVAELEAARALQTIQSDLQGLIESHPNTHAARRAERLLEDLDANPTEQRIPAAVESSDPNGPAFIRLDEVIVNLDEGRLNRYLDAELTLQVALSRYDEVSARIEAQHAVLQNWVIGYLSTQTVDGIRGAEAQERLRTEIKEHFNETLFGDAETPVEDVLFEKFIVQ